MYTLDMENNTATETKATEVGFSITHNISHSKGWGRYKASTASGKLIQSNTGNEWVSAPHSGSTVEGTEIIVVLQTMERVGKRREERVDNYKYRIVAETGETAKLGFWNGLEVVASNARLIGEVE